MHPTLQSPPHRRVAPPLPNKLFDMKTGPLIEAAQKEIESYLQSPARTECEKILATTVLDVIKGLSSSLNPRDIVQLLDEFFSTLKDYEEAQVLTKESYEAQIQELSKEIASSKKAKGLLPFSLAELDAKIALICQQIIEANSIQENAENELCEAEKRLNGYRPAVGEGKAKIEENRKTLETAYQARNRNYREISKTVEALKENFERLSSIKKSIEVLSTARLD